MSKKKHKQPNKGQVIIPAGHPNPPDSYEFDVAMILACHYQTTVEFLVPVDDYKRKTADITMLGVEWEIKCPTGNSKSTIGNQLRWAAKQANHIVIDTRHTKLQYEGIEKKVQFEVNSKASIKKAILINLNSRIFSIHVGRKRSTITKAMKYRE